MTDEPRACRHCGEPLRDVSEPQMGGGWVERWVHDYGGYSICFPQDAARSPRAEPLEQKQPLVAITIRTRKPGKWRFVDTETGEAWAWDVGQSGYRRTPWPERPAAH